jgi:hypothetical protein
MAYVPITTGSDSPRAPFVLAPSDLYSAHPYLDPDLFKRDRYAWAYFARLFRDHMRDDWHYARVLNRLLHPVREEEDVEVNERILATYFADATVYLQELLTLLPDALRQQFHLDPEVAECHDLRRLGEMLLEPRLDSERERQIRRYEVQRKLYLTKLLLQIDNTRMIQDGPRHRRYLVDLLDRGLWSHVTNVRDWEARYDLVPNGNSVAKNQDDARQEAWHFQVKRVERDLPGGPYDLEIYHFDTRFKKETAGFEYVPGQREYEVSELPRYGHMKSSRSGSILSKMLRKGLNDPTAITDMLGTKFIVGSVRDVHKLADLLHQILGGPFLFRNQVDLFRRPEDHDQLNRFSSREFKALKEDLDILYPAQESQRSRPYTFGVELQILTVDSFLRTVHSRDYVSHIQYKRRQFLRGVLPCVFPASLYGHPDLSGLED